jgi:hypothetical protein
VFEHLYESEGKLASLFVPDASIVCVNSSTVDRSDCPEIAPKAPTSVASFDHIFQSETLTIDWIMDATVFTEPHTLPDSSKFSLVVVNRTASAE